MALIGGMMAVVIVYLLPQTEELCRYPLIVQLNQFTLKSSLYLLRGDSYVYSR
jgi:hypothetical protein